MCNLHPFSGHLQNNCDIRRRRLLFRSWHRGTQESDLILGSFANSSLTSFDCADAVLLDRIIGCSAPPPEHDHDVMRLLRVFCAGRHRTLKQNRQPTCPKGLNPARAISKTKQMMAERG